MFPPDVKERALVACARHCCVCHKFCSINIECHHITPEADGGSDTFENCIPLCFDCHADVMHYNVNHPKGTKFRPSELVLHRDSWFKKVAAGPIYAANPESQEIDRRLFRTVREKFSSKLVNFMTNHDFNAPFDREFFFQLEDFWHFSKAAENEFLDERMESLFGTLRASVRSFLNTTHNRTFAVDQSDMFGVPAEWIKTESGQKRADEAVKALNDSAASVAKAFDTFVRDGRRILVTE